MKTLEVSLSSIVSLLQARNQWLSFSKENIVHVVTDVVPAEFPRPFEIFNIQNVACKIRYYSSKWRKLKGGQQRAAFLQEISSKTVSINIVFNQTALEERVSELEDANQILQERVSEANSLCAQKKKELAEVKMKAARQRGNGNRPPGQSPSAIGRRKRKLFSSMENVSPPGTR